MGCTIHLQGKHQTVNHENKDGEPIIITVSLVVNSLQTLIQKLFEGNEDLRRNVKITLTNIAELPKGFNKIIHHLADKQELLKEVFGPRSIKSLATLLPKAEEIEDPLHI